MPSRRSFLLGSSAFLFGAAAARAQAPAPMPVVASFSIVADFVRNVGGDRVAVATIVGPDEDAHGYQPKPSDARALAGAKLVVVNGLEFEGWLRRLIRSSGTTATVVEAAAGVDIIRVENHGRGHGHGHSHGHSHGGVDPHAWQSALEVKRYVEAIRAGLSAADPSGAETYARNAAEYTAKLDALHAEVSQTIARIPQAQRKAITTHDAFAYFERAYGFDFIAAQGVSAESEPTPAQIGRLIRQIREQGVKALFVENISSPRLIERIARETGARMGGSLYSDALSAADGPASTYIDMMRHNVRTIAAAIVSA
jgi:zinc/manganese transport system substrate-binding protein